MVSVHSEIGRLRQVLLHEPGKEVDQMIPEMMEELLFDDILYGDQAREEHGRFRRILQLLGVEIFESQQLLSETLQFDEARAWLWPRLVEHVEPDFEGLWNELPPKELAEALVGGYRRPRTDPTRMTKHDLFSITPLPNWCFQRDPQVVMYEGVMFGAMCSPARQRETLYSQAIFRFHPMLRETPIFFDPAEATDRSHLLLRLQQPELEGGDFLVLSEDILLVGCSQRTNDVAIHYLANELACKEHGPRWMFVVDLPKKRAYMHLDTLMTPVDHDTALVYPPVILSNGSEAASIYEIDLHADQLVPKHCPDGLLPALKRHNIDLQPIFCGGNDPVFQQREQWTDGANALAIAPGVLTLYAQNSATAEALDQAGFNVISAESVLFGREDLHMEQPKRTCILLSCHEISRARGGPHCLSHPLKRDRIKS